MNIKTIANAVIPFGTKIEILTQELHPTKGWPSEMNELASELCSLGLDVVIHDQFSSLAYFHHDVTILYNIDHQYHPVEMGKTILAIGDLAIHNTDYLSTNNRYNWSDDDLIFVQNTSPERIISTIDIKKNQWDVTSWEHSIRATYPQLLKYREEGRLFPLYSGPVQDMALDQLSTLDLIDHIKKKVYNEGFTHIAFDDKDEAIYWNRIYKIHCIIARLKDIFPKGSFLYLTASLNGPKIYSDWCKRHKVEEELAVIPAARFETVSKNMMFQSGLNLHINEIDNPIPLGKRPKKYLCYNRMPRLHRLKVITELHKANFIKDGHVSFHNEDGHLNHWGRNDHAELDKEWTDTFKYFFDNVQPELDYTLNKTAERWNPADLQQDDIQHFTESYFSIVNETLFYKAGYKHEHLVDLQATESVFLSEKIYKPLAMKHPFIVVGVDTTLENLRKFGYKTFSKWFDESYDLEPDCDKRMDLAINEMKRLIALSDDEWQLIIKDMAPTLQHNFNRLAEAKNLIPTNINMADLFKKTQLY